MAGGLSDRMQGRIARLLASGSRVLGLRLCFHDHLNQRSRLPLEYRAHHSSACETFKKSAGLHVCTKFDQYDTYVSLGGHPEGRMQVCPAGFTELVVPVFSDGLYAGVLFAGQCWLHDEPPPDASLIVPPDRAWLEERLTLLGALGRELGYLMRGEERFVPESRRTKVLEFLNETLERPVTLEELAKVLRLSPSRTGHLIREEFETTFPRLVQEVKLREAARLLRMTDLPVGQVAAMVGYDDPNYFSRLFTHMHRLPPLRYRRQNPAEA